MIAIAFARVFRVRASRVGASWRVVLLALLLVAAALTFASPYASAVAGPPEALAYAYDPLSTCTTPPANTPIVAARAKCDSPNAQRSSSLSTALSLAAKAADDVGTGLARTRVPISQHAAERMAEFGVTERMVNVAVQRGTRYYDRLHGTYSHVLQGGFASGHTLQVATNPLTGNVTTVIKQSRRFNPDVLLPSGQPRYIPAGP